MFLNLTKRKRKKSTSVPMFSNLLTSIINFIYNPKNLLIIFVIFLVTGILANRYFFYSGITQGPSVQKNATEILVSTLPDMKVSFDKMKGNGWDVNKPLIYSYYFYDHDEMKLAVFSKILQNDGFHIGILDKSATYVTGHQYLLYITEKAVHTPESLLEQCNKLTNLAVKYKIEIFDGWEVGQTSLDGQTLSTYQD